MTIKDLVNIDDKLFLMDNSTCELHYINGKWVNCHYVCSVKYPVIELSTNNSNEMYLRALYRKLKGAKCVYRNTYTNYDEDPYGRKVARGSIEHQIWDLRELVGSEEPLDELLDYVQKRLVHSQHPELVNID